MKTHHSDISSKSNQMILTLEQATGPVQIPMTNDYLFRALLQKNNHVLKGLICSLLHLKPEEVLSVTILNPIILGASIDNKDFLMDIRCLLNDNTIINLEMQVINQHNWTDRSLSYLCRSFDNLKRGEDYIYVKTAIQIGILDFTLFPDAPEFYATYMLANIKNHKIYSSKLKLSVLDLTQTDLATEEDRLFHIDYWASLFKSTTWEEIKMLAQKDSIIKEASDTILQLSQDEQIRLRCEARADYLYWQRVEENYKKELEENYQKVLQEKNQLENEKFLINHLNQMLLADNRIEDLSKSICNAEFQKQLLQEYHLIPEE